METKGDYIRRKCLERLNTNPNLGVLEFQDGIFVGMEYNETNKYSEEDMLLAFIAGVDKESYGGVSFYMWFEQFKKNKL